MIFWLNFDYQIIQFDIKLPAAVDEYYEVKAKCEADGWVPGVRIHWLYWNANGIYTIFLPLNLVCDNEKHRRRPIHPPSNTDFSHKPS